MTEAQRAQLFKMRQSFDTLVMIIKDSPAEINDNMVAIRYWHPGVYGIGDVRMFDNIPYKCIQTHSSADNPDWTPASTPALWIQYHGTTPDTARPYIAPTGAHNIYKKDEYMIYTDGNLYKCLTDTSFSPTDYAQAWEIVVAP